MRMHWRERGRPRADWNGRPGISGIGLCFYEYLLGEIYVRKSVLPGLRR